MKHIYIINGPNLNLLGQRDPAIYGQLTYAQLEASLQQYAQSKGITITVFQTNHEGVIIDLLQQADRQHITGIIINAGAFTHYAYAIHDAIEAIRIPVIEVHLSNIYTRKEPWRHLSVLEPVVKKQFYGEGEKSYFKAIDFLNT
jgi:3-dehydroquinate dehydratase type II